MPIPTNLSPRQKAVAEKVAAAAERLGVPVDLALAAAMQESSLGENLDSGAGPKGVMMVGNRLAKDMKIDQQDEDQNIEAGLKYLKQHLDRFGTVDDALVAYHDGPNSAYFKGGDMSAAAANHIQQVKKYMGTETASEDPDQDKYLALVNGNAKENDGGDDNEYAIAVQEVAPIADFSQPTMTADPSSYRDMNDALAATAGAGVGYGVGKSRQLSSKQKQLSLQAQRLAIQQQRLAQEAAEKAAAAKARPAYGTGTENWKNTEYSEPIARQIINPSDKKEAERRAQEAIARQNKAQSLFPNQVPAGPNSLLTIPVTTGGQTSMPTRPPQPPGPAMPPPVPPLNQTAAMQTLNAPGRGSTAASTVTGALAGAQAYDAYRQLMEGNVKQAGQSGLSALSALFSTFAKKPWMKAIGAAGSVVPEIAKEASQYFGSAEQPAPEPAPPAYAQGGLIGGLPHLASGKLVSAAGKPQMPWHLPR